MTITYQLGRFGKRKWEMKKKLKSPKKDTLYLVIWWYAQNLYAAVFRSEEQARVAADPRNGVVIRVRGRALEIDSIVDYYRRDESGNPMPAEWRTLEGLPVMPWMRGEKAAA